MSSKCDNYFANGNKDNDLKKGDSFVPVVLLLKIILNQQELDKPFTGGLGSFKLYVLVASHVSWLCVFL